jgi:hypothetical protein
VTPTARSLAELRKRGYLAGVVERHNVFSRKKSDLFGFLDVVAVRDGEILGIQATSGSNVSARIAKIRAAAELPIVLSSGMRIAVWGWAKRGKRNKRKVWTLREEVVTG